MKQSVKIDASNWRTLRMMFGTYGYRPQQSILMEAGGIRFWLPAGVRGVTQTGVYSYFAFAGDFEVTCNYELNNVGAPRVGRGSRVGLAIDVGDAGGRATIGHLQTPENESGYVLFGVVADSGQEPERRFVPSNSKRGRIGLRRTNKELIFLASDTLADPAHEIGRMTFTSETIRSVQFFAGPAGGPTAVDARLRDIEIRAEEITGGIPQRDAATSSWWWLWILAPACGVLLLWRWRVRRSERDDEASTSRPRPGLRRNEHMHTKGRQPW